jgi:hypothetical protein
MFDRLTPALYGSFGGTVGGLFLPAAHAERYPCADITGMTCGHTRGVQWQARKSQSHSTMMSFNVWTIWSSAECSPIEARQSSRP